jgi:phenylacetate-CoA ligase
MVHILEKVRKLGFWIVDAFWGGKIRRHYKDIAFILENYSSESSRLRREKHLENLLFHATTTTEFYKPVRNYTSLNDFPVINKRTIRENLNEIRSEKYWSGNNYRMDTSGSSGTPFTTYHDANKRSRNTADTIYLQKKAGFELGHRLYYIRKWFKMHRKNALNSSLQNIHKVDVTEFTDNYLRELISTIKDDPSTKVLLGYSSGLREICRYLRNTRSAPVESKISCIIAMAESLGQDTRESLEYYFNAPVLSRYSNLENGILSLQFPNMGNCYHINWASYYIEILHPLEDIAVPYGQLGRVVVTDLFNYCMPLIRYDTGDLAIMTESTPYFNKAPAFERVEGRKMDIIYDTSGKPQSTFIVFHLEAYPEIKQFQFIQQGEKRYVIKLNMQGPFKEEKKLSTLFKGYLGNDAVIDFQYVDEIPQLSSGKRRIAVNNFRYGINEYRLPEISKN